MKLIIDFSQIAKSIRNGLRKFARFARVPLTAIQYASAFLIMVAFACLVPVAFFFTQAVVLKVFAVFGIACATYYLTEGLLHLLRKPKKSPNT